MGIRDGMMSELTSEDATVGTIVWVRRRNGSWWPGKIVGPQELASSHLMSPRSGTPVKLLGRDDASVDWYNLEKSRRVKAFRCGEFDDCIEKAASFQGKTPVKKREKYARREDAIRHALELEREQLEKKPKLRSGANSFRNKKLKNGLGTLDNLANGQSILKSQTTSKKLDSSVQVKSMGNSLYARKSKHGKQPTSEGKTPPQAYTHVKVEPTTVQSVGVECPANRSEKLLDMKRKRAAVQPSEFPAKKRDRRRCLSKVLQNSAKVDGESVSTSAQGEKVQTEDLCRMNRIQGVSFPAELNNGLDHTDNPGDKMLSLKSQFKTDRCHVDPSSSTEENSSSGTMEDESSDTSDSEDVDQDMDENTPMVPNAIGKVYSGRHITGNSYNKFQSGRMGVDELDEAAYPAYRSQQHIFDQSPVDYAGVKSSRWQFKGRNIHSEPRRSMDSMDQDNSNGIFQGTYLDRRPNLYHKSDELDNRFEDELIENWGYGRKKYQPKLEAAGNDRDRKCRNFFDSEGNWERNGLSQVASRRYWGESSERFQPAYGSHYLNDRTKSLLVDVDIKVQSGYHGEHVPLVSLMSRLNGKAIIGHPIRIEVLEDDSMDPILASQDLREATIYGNGGMSPVPPAWRTARRTVMLRIRRPNPSSSAALNGGQAEASNQSFYRPPDLETKLSLYRKSYSSSQKTSRDISEVHSSRKTQNESLKKVTLASQRTRMLSSFAAERKHNGKAMSDQKLLSRSTVAGLNKWDEVGPTVVTCIPVKLVFSRLMETIGRPPSSRTERRSYTVAINGGDNGKEDTIVTEFPVKEV
ncbi:uncharacterized protein At1g51745-like [Papaver somniferum]|uniref:uncharacterized protein At1g51745-like n=1 Tax=Papaver somniferum TaxID=3469 RepID=UPI000E6FDBE4|nr:uncharacterized protein At1g51745-like [Papaver somniferum]